MLKVKNFITTRNRDRDVLGKEKGVLGEEKGALGNENDNYFGTKFGCYKIKYFETEGVYKRFNYIGNTINLNVEYHLSNKKGQTQCRRLPHEWGLGKG